MIDERYHKLECSVKQEAEAAAAAQNLKGTGAADAKTQAEGCDEGEAAASEEQAEAAVAAQKLKEAEARKKRQAEGWTKDEATRSRSGDAKSAAAKEKTQNAGDGTGRKTIRLKKLKKVTRKSKDSLKKEGASRKETNSS